MERVEYQARSADEATRVAVTCPMCPLDSSKVKVHYRPLNHPRGMTIPTRPAVQQQGATRVVEDRKIWRIRVEVTDQNKTPITHNRHITSSISTRRSRSVEYPKTLESNPRYQYTGPTEGYCEAVAECIPVGLGAVLEVIQLYTVVTSDGLMSPSGTPALYRGSGSRICNGTYEIIERNNDGVVYYYTSSVPPKTYVVVQRSRDIEAHNIARMVSDMYSKTCAPTSMFSYIDRRTIAEYCNLAPRAWDTSSPPTSGYVFTSKPDGERMWLVRYGLFWYGFSFKLSKDLVKWWWGDNPGPPTKRHIVMDTEYVANYGFIFIDSLTHEDGTTVPAVRGIEYSLDIVNKVQALYPDNPVKIRTYFDDAKAALEYSLSREYPTDGVLAIRNGSTETLKVKSVKSVELLLESDGSLVTADGDAVAKLDSFQQHSVGEVIEVRFTAKEGDTTINVIDMFPRSNKTTPNSTEAVTNILRSCVEPKSGSDKERIMVVRWCNALCSLIIERAMKCDNTKHIVLDIGTGSGQSLDRLKRSDSVSFIYLEPDKDRARAVARRSGARMVSDPLVVGTMVSSLKSRKTTQIVLNCSMEELMENQECCSRLMPELKCAICTFSAHFVVEQLSLLKHKYNVRIFGCMYTYDWARGGVLVDSCGSSMVMVSDREAIVSWGREAQYKEPVTYQQDYYGTGSVVMGSDLLPLPSGPDSGDPAEVCRHIRVIV